MQTIKPFSTLVLSADGTYPGLVLDKVGAGHNVRWFKWGYVGPDYMDVWETEETIERHRIGYKTVAEKFGNFPLQMRTDLKKAWAEKQLNRLVDRWVEEGGSTWGDVRDFVLGLMDD